MWSRRHPCKRCSSSDAVDIAEESGIAKCHSCGAAYKYDDEEEGEHMTTVKTKRDDRDAPSLEEIATFSTRGMRDRGISKKTMEHYGVTAAVDSNGQVFRFFFPQYKDGALSGYISKHVSDKSKTFSQGDVNNLFGAEKLTGGRRLIITEGQEDCLAVQEANDRYYGRYYDVVSMNGVNKLNELLANRDTIVKYDEVLLWFDNDEQGKKAAIAAARIVGYDRAKMVQSEEKDACDRLARFGEKPSKAQMAEFFRVIWDAQPYSPASVIKGEDTWEAYQEFKNVEYVPWPPFLEKLNSMTYGRALGSITMFAAGCHGPGTRIMMEDGQAKKVEDIVIGDRVTAPFGRALEVKATVNGFQPMFRVRGDDGVSYTANLGHTLVLFDGVTMKFMTVQDYAALAPEQQQRWGQARGMGVGSHKSREFYLGVYEKLYRSASRIDDRDGVYFDDLTEEQVETLSYILGATGRAYRIPHPRGVYVPHADNDEPVRFTVTPIGVGEFYGFTLEEGEHLYQLSNGVVTHNTGIGKTSLLMEDIAHLLSTTEEKIGACFLEDSIGSTVSNLVAIALSRRIGLPDVEVTEEEERQGWEETLGTGRIVLVDHQGSVSDGSLLDKIEYLALSGCRYIYLDHITIAVAESEDKDVNKAIDVFMGRLLSLVKRHNVWIGVVSHLRKVKQGEESFESGGQITEDDLKGSGSLKQISFQTIGISRNKLHEDEAKRHVSQLWLLKDRKTGASGPAGSYRFDTGTGRLLETQPEEDVFVEMEPVIV